MTDNNYPRREGGPLVHATPTSGEIEAARGLFGSLEAYSRKRAADRLTSQLDAASRAIISATRLQDAKLDFIRARERLSAQNLELIRLEEEFKVEEEFLNREVRLADARLKKEMFADQAKVQKRRLQTELIEEEIKYQEAYERLHGRKPEKKEEGAEEKRARLETRQDELAEEISKLAAEYLEKSQAGTLTDAEKQAFVRKNNTLVDRLAKVEDELAAL